MHKMSKIQSKEEVDEEIRRKQDGSGIAILLFFAD